MAATKLCIICGYVGQPRLETKGTFIMEVFLWLIFLLPGLIYSIWRITTRYDACPECAAANMIPTSSPVAQKLLQEHRQPQPAQNTQRRGAPPPPPSGERSFRVARNGQDLGELPVSTIKQMIANGQLSMQDYYLDAEANDWMQLEWLADVA